MKEETGKSRLRQMLTDEVKRIIWIIAFVRGVAVPYFWIKEDISLIKNNHMAHVEWFSKEIAKLSEQQSEQQKMLIELMKEVAKSQR